MTMTSTRRSKDIGYGQIPFQLECTSPLMTGPDAVTPTFQDLHKHVKDHLERPEEHPLLDSPFDTMIDKWHILKDTEVNRTLLHFFVEDTGHGLDISPTGTFLILSRSYSEDIATLFTTATNCMNAMGEPTVSKLVDTYGLQTSCAHAYEIAVLHTVLGHFHKTIITEPAARTSILSQNQAYMDQDGNRHFPLDSYNHRQLLRAYSVNINKLTTEMLTCVANAADSQMSENSNIRNPSILRMLTSHTPRKVFMISPELDESDTSSQGNPSRTFSSRAFQRRPAPSTDVRHAFTNPPEYAPLLGTHTTPTRLSVGLQSPTQSKPIPSRTPPPRSTQQIVHTNGNLVDMVHSPTKFLTIDGTIPSLRSDVEFGLGGHPIAYDEFGVAIPQKAVKLHTYTMPSSSQQLTWNNRYDSILDFIERIEIWLPSVDSAGILDSKNLAFYCKNGLEVFVQTFHDPIHNPRCNIIQLREAIRHVYQVLALAFHRTDAHALVVAAKHTHDGWQLWRTFRSNFETEGLKSSRAEGYLARLSDKFTDEPTHSYATLLRFVNKFATHAAYLSESDLNWTDDRLRTQFLSVVRHPSTQYLIK